MSRILTGAVCASLLLAAYAGYRLQGARLALANEKFAHAQTAGKLEAEKADRAQALATAIAQARKEDLSTINKQREALNAAQDKTDALQDARKRSDAVAGGLRDQLAAANARATAAAADPKATEECRATARTASVLTGLLERLSQERRELADYADRARIAGELCQRSYEALSAPP